MRYIPPLPCRPHHTHQPMPPHPGQRASSPDRHHPGVIPQISERHSGRSERAIDLSEVYPDIV